MAAASPYDAIPYPARAFPQTHPDRLATLATLHGLQPARPTTCRVLELGCGAGANLLAMAAALPAASFVGIDSSRRSIARAQAVAEHLGLANVAFSQTSIEDYEPPADRFDYVVAHGVLSWVPEPVRDRLLAICAGALDEHGVAYVSYNARPGGHARRALRELLGYHVATLDDPGERIAAARGLLALLRAAASADDALAPTLGAEAARILEQVDGLLFHDTLAEHNHALYVHELVDEAGRHGLQFLSEAEYADMSLDALPGELAAALRAIADPVRREQYRDFLTERTFRQTLLCRATVAVERPVRPARLAPLAASAHLRESDAGDAGVTFHGAGTARLTSADRLVVATLRALAAAWPRALPVAALASPDELGTVCSTLLRCYGASLVGLHVESPAVSAAAGPRPRVSALARLQAQQGEDVTTPRLTAVALEDAGQRRLVALLDGTRDRAALLDALVADGSAPRNALADALERRLERLARTGLLLDDGA